MGRRPKLLVLGGLHVGADVGPLGEVLGNLGGRELVVIVDVLYILFNINYIDSPSSYWAIIIPLWFAVDLTNDSFTRAAQEQVVHLVVKRAR